MTYSASMFSEASIEADFPDLKFGMAFADLYCRDGLVKLDQAFLDFLQAGDAGLHARLVHARSQPEELAPKDESAFLIELAPWLEDFIAQLFSIDKEVRALAARHHELAPLYFCKRQFVQRRAKTKVSDEVLQSIDGFALEQKLEAEFGKPFSELVFATHVAQWLENEAANATRLEDALHYAAWALRTTEGQIHTQQGVLFKSPKKLEYLQLLTLSTDDHAGYTVHRVKHLRHREGFSLTDNGTDLVGALDEANYCIWCHEQGKDSCSKGYTVKSKNSDEPPSFKINELGALLAGCPLEERISEFHKLKTQGVAIGSLAMIVLDNPMCAGTGHRICNDCMKSCIYQKQDPVDIPQAETRTLKDVLELPWGFEIYSLLTRWNPLDLRRPLPRPSTGKKVLVVGMGPAGYTLAHHLLNDGHTVVGIDGLKIEPLPAEISGVNLHGERVSFHAVRDTSMLRTDLAKRLPSGFGGVAEYGITVRWDKNFLQIIRLLLERRSEFALYGGVRFGGTMTVDDALAL